MSNRSQATSATASALALEPAAWPADWRQDWEIKEEGDASPRAWHRSGLCFFFEFEQIDERGNWAWVVYDDDDISQSRLYELQGEMGEEAFDTFSLVLGSQAKTLWQERGHGDFTLNRR